MLDVALQYSQVFLLVLVRMSSFFFLTPFFGTRNVPAAAKTGLAFLLTIIVTPAVADTKMGALYLGASFADLVLVLLKELMVGLTLGLTAAMIFAAVQVGGMFIDLQIGFAMANVFDPMSGASAPLTGQFKYALAFLLFLGLDGHHGLIAAMLQSYNFVPIGAFQITDNLMSVLMQTFSAMFLLGLKIAIPVVAALFLVDFGFAMLSKAVPQMNVFALGMSVKTIVGGLMIIFTLPAFVYLLRGMFHTMFDQMDTILRVLGG
ncbi:flagellar type III secretion system protein FliR [Tumebacillus sp. ITR2]|uniref:Flagellar biosynthetic protein FliR n=1 Tax=Tumebacillus amylolyticus TaxID=2801339 RepID=A0ABS1JF70_9BACL|nr:flagellar biosynthetic protein FliR [Tumebacillus amylolyticus]MBL0388926.1 flagellar type III secretion system protein FliR [Tumebacillus amylolyticus]